MYDSCVAQILQDYDLEFVAIPNFEQSADKLKSILKIV